MSDYLDKKWCVRHNNQNGGWVPKEEFSDPKYSYCDECKREYQRKWDRKKREIEAAKPSIRQYKNRIVINIPADETGYNVVYKVIAPEYDEIDGDFR